MGQDFQGEVDLARDLKHPINCFACHDPHSAQPRVVRDGLIEAVVDKEGGTYPYDKEKSRKITMKKVMFRDFRAIGILSKPDSNLMCAQCHVEYNCNPGHNPETGEAVGMGDRRTNFFPWVNVFDYKAKMDEAKFRDFKHAVTGHPSQNFSTLKQKHSGEANTSAQELNARTAICPR